MVSERTLYRLVDYSLFGARNIDLPRKVLYARRRQKRQYKVDKACRVGRGYQDFLEFMAQSPDLPVTELESDLEAFEEAYEEVSNKYYGRKRMTL